MTNEHAGWPQKNYGFRNLLPLCNSCVHNLLYKNSTGEPSCSKNGRGSVSSLNFFNIHVILEDFEEFLHLSAKWGYYLKLLCESVCLAGNNASGKLLLGSVGQLTNNCLHVKYDLRQHNSSCTAISWVKRLCGSGITSVVQLGHWVWLVIPQNHVDVM